jgi:hypothetical protein
MERNALLPIARLALLAALLATGSQALAAPSSLSKAERVGKSLFEQDRAAWLATDRLVESNGQVPAGVRGWVTVPSRDGWRVIFVQGEGDAYCSMLDVLVNANGAGPLRRSDTCERLTMDQRAMFLARQTALSALHDRCSEAYNTVVMPPEGKNGAWAVYLLAATSEAGKVVVGGHVRVLVGDGGSKIVDYQPLSKACLTLDLPSPDAGKAVALVVTHVLNDHPIETHVFVSLLHGLNLYVMTENALWSVDKGKIRLLMDGEEFKAYLGRAKAARDEETSADDR